VCCPPAQGPAPLSGLHQHHREHERHDPAGQPQREALAGWLLRWTAAGMMEAKKGFRRLMAYKQLPMLKAALLAHQAAHSAPATSDGALACTGEAA
jgi:hypothetical protein